MADKEILAEKEIRATAGIVSTEQDEDEDPKLINDEDSRSKDDSDREVKTNESQDEDDDFQTKYNLNIFNAYILLKGKAQIGDSVVLKDLRFSVYVVFVIQCAAMIVLSRLVMLQSGDTIDDYEMVTWPEGNSFLLFPFFIIAAVTFYKDLIRVLTDMVMLKHDIGDECSSKEFWVIKCGEMALALYGAFGYLVMLALYADYDYSGMLFTVLKMLAYKFILQLDEGMVELVVPELDRVLRKEGKPELEKLFTGIVQAKFRVMAAGGQSNSGGSRPRMQSIITIFSTYALILQALYSSSWALFCFIPLVWFPLFCFIPLMWTGSLGLCFCCDRESQKEKTEEPEVDLK